MNTAHDTTPGTIRPQSGQRVYVDREDGLYWMDGPALMYAGPYRTDGTLDWENAGDVDMEASDPDVIERARKIILHLTDSPMPGPDEDEDDENVDMRMCEYCLEQFNPNLSDAEARTRFCSREEERALAERREPADVHPEYGF